LDKLPNDKNDKRFTDFKAVIIKKPNNQEQQAKTDKSTK